MKILSVNIKNFRNLEDVSQVINGSNILLIGENTVGKSNFIKAIEIALGMTSRVGENPVMDGKKESHIEVITGADGKNYTFEVKFKAGSTTPTLTVTGPDGLRNKTKSAIGSIVGEIDFDIDKFVEMSKTAKGRKEQVEIVKSFFPEDIQIALRKYENHVASLYEDRTDVNRRIKDKEGAISQLDITGDTVKKYKEPKDFSHLSSQIKEANDRKVNIEKASMAREQHVKTAISCREEIQKLHLKILESEKMIEEAEADIKKIDAWTAKNPLIDTQALMNEMEEGNKHNILHERVKNALALQKELEELRSEAEDMTVRIETERQLIADTIRDMEEQMPIDGLTFNDESLFYQGRPVDESTLSTSEKMMLGARLKIAKNPNVPVLFIQQGESLGTKKFNDLISMAKEHDFQIIMEQMVRGEEELRIEFIPEP